MEKTYRSLGILLLALGALWFLISCGGVSVISFLYGPGMSWDEITAIALSSGVLVVFPALLLVGIGTLLFQWKPPTTD